MNGETRLVSVVVCLAVVLMIGHRASAQGYPYSYPTPPPQDQPPPSATSEPEPKEKVGAHRGFQGGFNIGVPIWLDVDRDLVRPGADLHFFGGYDIGYAMFGINLGAMWTPIDFGSAFTPPGTNVVLSGRQPLTRLYFSAEARVQIPNSTPFLPYLAIAADFNFWNFKETGVACGIWYCTEVNIWRFTPGFTAKVGFAFRIKRGAHIDVGAKYTMSGQGDFFFRREQWFTPYLGFFFR